MLYQSLSEPIWTGPNVLPVAVWPVLTEVSIIDTSSDVANKVPVLDPLLISIWNISISSVDLSPTIVLEIEPTPLVLIPTEPIKVPSVKSVVAINPFTCSVE